MPDFNRIDRDEIVRRFTNVKPSNEESARIMDQITAEFIELGDFITQVMPTPAGRELALAITNLEQTMFWVKKGFALNQP